MDSQAAVSAVQRVTKARQTRKSRCIAIARTAGNRAEQDTAPILPSPKTDFPAPESSPIMISAYNNRMITLSVVRTIVFSTFRNN